MDTTLTLDPRTLGYMLLATRLGFGLLFAVRGLQTLLGWTRGTELGRAGYFFSPLGFHQGKAFAALAGATEVVSGVLIALGLLGPIGPALLVSVMVVDIATVQWRRYLLISSNGIELPLLYTAAAIWLALLGPGPYALDASLNISSIWTPGFAWVVLALGAMQGVANVMLRHRWAVLDRRRK